MTSEPNPYQSAATPSDAAESNKASFGRPLAALVSVFVCSAVSIVAGEIFTLIGMVTGAA